MRSKYHHSTDIMPTGRDGPLRLARRRDGDRAAFAWVEGAGRVSILRSARADKVWGGLA
jgi:hypothetical protein